MTFFERRWAVLKHFEDADLLQQHRVVNDRIAIRLGDAYHLITFGSDYVAGALLRPDSDSGRLREGLRKVFEILEPHRLLLPEFDYQWLVKLDRPYDDVRRLSAFAGFGDSSDTVIDWAVTLDGLISEPAATYRAEFGILEASDAAARLSRAAGMVYTPDPDVPPTLWPPQSFPPVAWFFDARCRGHLDVGEADADTLFDVWSKGQDAVDRIQSGFMARFHVGEA